MKNKKKFSIEKYITKYREKNNRCLLYQKQTLKEALYLLPNV